MDLYPLSGLVYKGVRCLGSQSLHPGNLGIGVHGETSLAVLSLFSE